MKFLHISDNQAVLLGIYDHGLHIHELPPGYARSSGKRPWCFEGSDLRCKQFMPFGLSRSVRSLERRKFIELSSASQFNGTRYKRTELGEAALRAYEKENGAFDFMEYERKLTKERE